VWLPADVWPETRDMVPLGVVPVRLDRTEMGAEEAAAAG
jgi:hypothetical protein